MATLWIASDNRKKRGELERLLGPLGLAMRPLAEAPRPVEIVEDAPDFAGNAEKKAVALARVVGEPAIGDDSGLCVDALDGRPGVRSARYAGPDATDADRITKLLGELEGIPAAERTARFVCHICLADRDGAVLARFEAACEGEILEGARGSAGFGYDPVFVAAATPAVPATAGAEAKTFAELTAEEKDALSHRGKALRQLVEYLRQHPLD